MMTEDQMSLGYAVMALDEAVIGTNLTWLLQKGDPFDQIIDPAAKGNYLCHIHTRGIGVPGIGPIKSYKCWGSTAFEAIQKAMAKMAEDGNNG